MTERLCIPVPKPRPAPAKISDALFNRPGFVREGLLGKLIPMPASGEVEIRVLKSHGPAMTTHWTEHSSYSGRYSSSVANAIEVKRNNNP